MYPGVFCIYPTCILSRGWNTLGYTQNTLRYTYPHPHTWVSKKTEHFRRWQQFLRYLVTHGYAYVHIVRTFEELANALTKIENRHAYITFRKIAMNIPLLIVCGASGTDG